MSKLTKIFSSVLGIEESEVTPELSPENSPKWDSLNAIILFSEIENGFNTKFNYDEVMAVKNFADVIELMKTKGLDANE